MPVFEFTSPEGKKYRVTGPEGATQEEAFGMLQKQLSATPTTAPRPKQAVPAEPAAPNTGLMSVNAANRAIAGIPDAVLNTPNRLLNLGKAAVGTAATALGRPDLAPTPTPDPDFVRKGFEQAGFIKPELDPTTTGQRMLSSLVQGGVGAALGSPANSLRQMATNAGIGAVSGGVAGGVQEATGSAPLSITAGLLSPLAAGRAVSAVRQPGRSIDAETARLANRAQEDFDIPLRPDQLYNNRIAKMAGEAMEKVPLSGAPTEARQNSFNRAVIKTIGGNATADKLTPDVFDQAIRTSGKKIGDIAARNNVRMDQDFDDALNTHVMNADRFETTDVGRVVKNYVDELRNKTVNGVISGEAFRKLNTEINAKIRNTANGDLKHALGGLQDDMQNALERVLTGNDLTRLQNARQQYAIAKTIEPIVAKTTTGDISPAALMGRVTSNQAGKSRMARGTGGDIGDLARIGQRFLKEPNSSGTAERSLAYGMLGGGAVMEPATAAGIYGLANAYNRAGPAVSRRLSSLAAAPPSGPTVQMRDMLPPSLLATLMAAQNSQEERNGR